MSTILWQNFFMVIMRMENDFSSPKCSQRQNSSSGAGSTSLPLAPGVPHTRERPSFANHQINKKVSNFTADYSRPGNSKIGFTANSSGNPGGQVRKQRAEGVGESMAVNKKINISLATRKIRFATVAANNWPATHLTLNNIHNMQTVTAG